MLGTITAAAGLEDGPARPVGPRLAQATFGVAGLKPRGPRRRFTLDAAQSAAERPLVEIAAVLALGAFAAHTVLPDGGSVAHFFDYRLYYAIIVAAAGLTIARAVFSPLHRGAWIAIAAAVTSYATAEFIWLFLYSSSDNPPYPSIADAFYLGFYPASYVGLLLLLRARLRSLTPGVWVDGITAALAVAAIGSAVLIGVVLETTDGPASVVATNMAYPLGDVILLSLVVGGFALTRWHPGRAWAFLGASLTISALADSAYLYATATGTYSEGGVLDAAWPTGLLLIGIAAWQDDGRDRIVDMRGRQLLAIPTLCAFVAVTLLIVDHFHRLNLVAITLATLTLAGSSHPPRIHVPRERQPAAADDRRGHHRLAHGPRQPTPPDQRPRRGHGGGDDRGAVAARDLRPGRVQGLQRRVRPPRRRCPAGPPRRQARGRDRRPRPLLSPRRRRVLPPDAGGRDARRAGCSTTRSRPCASTARASR